MNAADEPGVLVRLDDRGAAGHVAWLTINNPRRLNVLSSELLNAFVDAVAQLARDDALRALVVTGAGEKAFIGGADINEMAALDANTARGFITRLHRACESLRRLPVPVIARINGYALGGGLELAAACDLRIATETSIFGMPEVKLGIPSVIEAALLPRLVGWGRAREILLLGENFSAADALAWGLVERVVPIGELDEAVERYVQSLLSCGPKAIRLQKKLIAAWEELSIKAAVDAGIDAFEAAWKTDEPRAAMQRFQQARREK